MNIRDKIAQRSLELTRKEIDSDGYGAPWLNLDAEAFRAYRQGKTSVLPKPYCDDPLHSLMLADVCDKRVLCLAGGGGQQSALFSLLGAHVTVLDLTPEQLDRDQTAARHYGYEVATIQGDMRDLSMFEAAYFDRVYQPISTLYIPNLREVYREVARILKPAGLYYSDYATPLLYMAQNNGWDDEGYVLRVTEPYVHGAIFETEDGRLNFSSGVSFAEFHHLLSDIINGLIVEGFQIRSILENPRPGIVPRAEQLEPGSASHRDRFLPFGLSVVATATGILPTVPLPQGVEYIGQ